MNRKSIAAILAVWVMILQALPVKAADPYTAQNGQEIFIEVYLLMDKEANVPNQTFKFSIGPGADQNASDGYLQVFAGDGNRVTGSPRIGDAVFQQGQSTYTSPEPYPKADSRIQAADDKTDPVNPEAEQKYARSAVSIDFSGVSFKEPGVYRYLVTEEDGTDGVKGIVNDSDKTRTLDVYVENGNDGKTLVIKGYVLHNLEGTDPVPAAYGNGQPDGKSSGFVNTYVTENLTLKKEVSGNQASHDEYFAFTLTLEGVTEGNVYDVNLAQADAATSVNAINTISHENPSSIRVPDESTSVTTVFYLQGGQAVTVQGIAKGASYSVHEDRTLMTEEGYKVSAEALEGQTSNPGVFTEAEALYTDSAITEDTTVTFTNYKEGTIPTGIVLAVLPGAIALMAGLLGLFFLRACSRRRT